VVSVETHSVIRWLMADGRKFTPSAYRLTKPASSRRRRAPAGVCSARAL